MNLLVPFIRIREGQIAFKTFKEIPGRHAFSWSHDIDGGGTMTRSISSLPVPGRSYLSYFHPSHILIDSSDWTEHHVGMQVSNQKTFNATSRGYLMSSSLIMADEAFETMMELGGLIYPFVASDDIFVAKISAVAVMPDPGSCDVLRGAMACL